jgi:hypothetical protein
MMPGTITEKFGSFRRGRCVKFGLLSDHPLLKHCTVQKNSVREVKEEIIIKMARTVFSQEDFLLKSGSFESHIFPITVN